MFYLIRRNQYYISYNIIYQYQLRIKISIKAEIMVFGIIHASKFSQKWTTLNHLNFNYNFKTRMTNKASQDTLRH